MILLRIILTFIRYYANIIKEIFMKTQKKKIQKINIDKKVSDFYKKYNISSTENKSNDIFKPNGNFKYIWEFKSNSNTNITTSIY